MLAGFSSSLYATVSSLRGASGSIQSGLSTMQTRLSSLRTDEATLKDKLEARRKLLLAQYSSLDAKLVSMGQQRSNVANALASLR
jgi:flagellar capping protein FliD